MWEVTKVNLWFIGVLLIVLLLATYLPAFPLALVHAFYGG
jgi:TRAP-type C4-dicarboxylate transport system permease large subunit